MLNADELGEKGQARFREICANAKLVCNQSDRDRTGWDFIVESQFEALDAKSALETRKAPLIACHVQVKTLWERSDRFEMRLTSAEHLAKGIKPAFVLIFKVNDALEFTGAYLVHLLDAPLGKILTRLRKEDVAGTLAPNRKKITMSAQGEGLAIAPTGEALRRALEEICGRDANAYASKKAEQLTKLGFEARPIEIKLSLSLSLDELVDAFLGLTKNVPASDLSSTITRFGIVKPHLSAETAIVNIQPTPVGTCTVTVRGSAVSPPAVFQGKVYFPAIPNLPRENLKIVFDTELFVLVISYNRWTIELRPDIPARSPSAWVSYWRLAHVLATGSGTIQISSDLNKANGTLAITAKVTTLNPLECNHWVMLCEHACGVLKHAGVTVEPELSMDILYRNADKISGAYSLIHPEIHQASVEFYTEHNETIQIPFSREMLFAYSVELGPVMLGYCALAEVIGDRVDGQIRWIADNITLVEMTRLHTLPQDYEQMIDRAAKKARCQDVLDCGCHNLLPNSPSKTPTA
jgi:hypothetical protein